MSQVRNLVKNYSDFRIEIPLWDLPDTGISVLTGSSGSGKTSVIRLLLGLEQPDSLEWSFAGVDIAKQKVEDRKLGVVFQNYLLFPHLTARENILFGAQARQVSVSEVQDRLKDWEKDLSLSSFLDRRASLLSGGEQQRVALARALVGRPKFLFLDEPFSALDTNLRESSRKLVRDLIKKEGIPALLISHDEKDVQVLADHRFQISQGKLQD